MNFLLKVSNVTYLLVKLEATSKPSGFSEKIPQNTTLISLSMRRIKLSLLLILSLVVLPTLSYAAKSSWHQDNNSNSKSRFIATIYQDQNSAENLIGALQIEIPFGWKVYGNDEKEGISDGIGIPPSFDFTNSKNISNHEIIWPKANIGTENFGSETLKYSYYKNEVTIPVKITRKNSESSTHVVLNLNYGICKEVCIPVSDSFEIDVNSEIDAKVLQLIQKKTDIELSQNTAEQQSYSLLYIIIFGIIGGMILNVMPCVLPVLSIKLLSIIHAFESHHKHGKEVSNKTLRFAFLSTIIGIISCFAVLALIVEAIRNSGTQLGWGFQFQNPYFLTFLITVLTIFSANILGFFEFRFDGLITNFLNKKISNFEKEPSDKKHIFLSNFFSGILAVTLATPCSAPFLGTAISFALAGSFIDIFTIFIAIAIGFSAPYIIMIISPKMLKFLPKPGNWMIKFKKIIAFLLILTVIWLFFVLSGVISLTAAIITAILSLALFFSFKINKQILRKFAILTLSIAILSVSFFTKNKFANSDSAWKKFDEAEITRQVSLGNVVFVDITANWCLTCKFNKFNVIETSEIQKFFAENNIILMRGNITMPNPKIIKFMEKHGRFAIPFNAVFGPKAKKGLLTREILTKKEIILLIKNAQKK